MYRLFLFSKFYSFFRFQIRFQLFYLLFYCCFFLLVLSKFFLSIFIFVICQFSSFISFFGFKKTFVYFMLKFLFCVFDSRFYGVLLFFDVAERRLCFRISSFVFF